MISDQDLLNKHLGLYAAVYHGFVKTIEIISKKFILEEILDMSITDVLHLPKIADTELFFELRTTVCDYYYPLAKLFSYVEKDVETRTVADVLACLKHIEDLAKNINTQRQNSYLYDLIYVGEKK